MVKSDETLTVWANGFGVWHAKIVSKIGFGNAGDSNIDRHIDRIRAKACRAIRREILAREDGPIHPVRVEVDEVLAYGTGVIYSITFKEKV